MHTLQVWLPARTFVKKAIDERANVHASKEIILLEQSCPWKEHLYELEEEMRVDKPIKYCIYQARTRLTKFTLQHIYLCHM